MQKVKSTGTAKRTRPALTPEARENQLIAMAVDLAEKQLLEGTASSEVVRHYLELGAARDRLEREKLQEENKLLRAKTEQIESMKNMEAKYIEAIEAMKRYSGNGDTNDY